MSKFTDKIVVPLTADSAAQLDNSAASTKSITRLLIANRGEIACRIIDTAKRMGIETIAVYSEVDRQAKHVQIADHAVMIGAAPALDSYLNGSRIIEAALTLSADAIHPGYGFLSENAAFAETCLKNDIIFIGPPATAMQLMSSKSEAKIIMEQAQVPLIPGYHGNDNTVETLSATARQIGYPVLLKAALGGGGKGMRIVNAVHEMAEAIASAKREARSAFGDDLLLIEKYLVSPRHIEIQIFADHYGNTIYLSDRDCSIQRRHQKIVEEAPAPNLTDKLRQRMGQAAVDAAKAIGYIGAGTVEFLLDESGKFYFMEMNTRLQVEHPVTELITGQDLVEWQINVAKGKALPLRQKQVKHHGHAIETRIYAEDPKQDFLPASGRIQFLKEPRQQDGKTKIRIDSGILQGDTVTSHYDPMLSKLIVWSKDRELAINSLSQALARYKLVGLATNIDYLQQIICHPAFKMAKIDTHFIERHQAELDEDSSPIHSLEPFNADHKLAIPKLALFVAIATIRLDSTANNWRLNQSAYQDVPVRNNQGARYRFRFHFPVMPIQTTDIHSNDTQMITLTQVEINDHIYDIAHQAFHLLLVKSDESTCDYQIEINGVRESFTEIDSQEMKHIYYQTWHDTFHTGNGTLYHQATQDNDNQAIAPLNGIVTALHCKPGDVVYKDQPLLIIEAMKMEYTVRAPQDGTLSEILFVIGDQVEHGEQLVRIETHT